MAVTHLIVVIILTMTFTAHAQAVTYTSCAENSAYQNQGYTYSLDTSVDPYEKVWSHCHFVNPLYDQDHCGRPDVTDGTEFICDPDGILTSVAEGDAINAKLYTVQTDTATVCTDDQGRNQSFIIAVALIDRIREPDLQSPDLCINSCNELHPDLNTTARNSTDAEKEVIMENFGESLRTHWSLGICDNDIIVVYCQTYNKAYISRGSKVAQYISDDRIATLTANFMSYVNNGNLEEGLLLVTADIKSDLHIMQPAVILLIIGLCLILLFGLILFYCLFLRNRSESLSMLNMANKEVHKQMVQSRMQGT